MFEKTEIFGQRFDVCNTNSALLEINKLINSKESTIVSGKNVFLLTECDKDIKLFDFYNSCDLVTVDGRPLVYLSRFFSSQSLPEMVGGPNLWTKLLQYGSEEGYTFYFLGATDKILDKAEDNLKRDIPNLNIIGKHNGFFDTNSIDMENIIKELKVLKPNLIYIGLPTPYKEDIAIRLRKDLDFGCIVLIGGMFDVFAGEKKIGYKIVSYLCLDWFFRMIQEPRRLFRRYMSSNCYFVYMILKEFLISK